MKPWVAFAALSTALWLSSPSPCAADTIFPEPWPSPERFAGASKTVRFASSSPFMPADIGDAPWTETLGYLFMPPAASTTAPVPAVILLHGAAGVVERREIVYARQFAALGVAALVIDSFAARRQMARGFIDRLLNITETMLVADAFAGLSYLDRLPEVDGSRVALMGFSYGGMATIFAAYRQIAEALQPNGPYFAAHVAFYGPCIARFVAPATTGAPVLMLWGGRDAIIDPARCAEIADDLARGGSRVETIVYPEAVHQWDGAFTNPRPIGRNLAPCIFRVGRDGRVWNRNTYLPVFDVFTRKVSLAVCADEAGYLIGRDDAVRARSNRAVGAFLEEIFSRP